MDKPSTEVKFGTDLFKHVENYDNILFDFDDTLVKSEHLKREIIKDFFISAGVFDTKTDKNIFNYSRNQLFDEYSIFFKDIKKEKKRLSHRLRLLYKSLNIPIVNKKMLEFHDIIIVSSGNKSEILSCLKINGLKKNIPIYCSASKDKRKIFKNLNLKGKCVYIGDDPQDELSSKYMGWDFIKVKI